MNKVIYAFLCLTLCASFAEAKQIRIVVIDTGFNKEAVPSAKICKDGIIDFTGDGEGGRDELGHGTNIVGIIANELKDSDYCLYIIKIYTKTNKLDAASKYFAYILSLTLTIRIHPDVVNFSSSGSEENTAEKYLIKALTENGTIFVTAAGNESINLDSNCAAYPACYTGVVSVGNLSSNLRPHYSSNFGKRVSMWAVGTNITAGGFTMTGTSQSTAFATAAIVKRLQKTK